MLCRSIRIEEAYMTAQKTQTAPTPQPQAPDATERLEAIAQRVAADARRDPQAYRRESRVPAGGE
jgi:hypothetical protein